MVSIEPNESEVISFATVSDVADWAGVPSPAPDAGARSSLFALLGLSGSEHYRVLGAVPQSDFESILATWRVGEAAPSPALLASAGLWGRAARVACGAQRRVEDIQRNADLLLQTQASQSSSPPAAVALPNPVGSKRTVKFSTCVDQSSDLDTEALTQEEVDKAYARYDQRQGGFPPDDHDPSQDQLSGLKGLVVDHDLPPYVDFAVFGPHSIRVIRKLKLSGMVLNASGEFTRTELAGPTSYDQWEQCYMVFKTCMVMLGFATPAALEACKDHIKWYAYRYKEQCWALLYQADTRARRELVCRIRQAARDLKEQDGDGLRFDPKMPWEYVYRKLPHKSQFWYREFEAPAMFIRTGVTGADCVSGEAPIANRPDEHVSDPLAAQVPGPAGGRQPKDKGREQPKKPKDRSRSARLRVNNLDQAGEHTTNRQGRTLCKQYNTGLCPILPCPIDPKLAHQCSFCLDNRHGANACPRNAKSEKGSKGGKGKGKGKSSYHG